MPFSRAQSSTPTVAGGWRARIFVLVVVASLWLALSWSLTFHHGLVAILGGVSVVLVVWLTGRLGLTSRETVPLELTFRTLGYVPWLTWQVLVSSIDVLRRAWHPAAPRVAPETFRLEASQRTHVGLVTYANSITLTPGTLSLDADTRTRTLTVHAISKEGADDLRRGEMDRRVKIVEGDLGPDPDPDEEGAAEERRSEEDSAERDGAE